MVGDIPNYSINSIPYNILYLHNNVKIGGGERSLLKLWENMDREIFKPYLVVPEEGIFCKEARDFGVEISFLEVPKLRLRNVDKILISLLRLYKFCTINQIKLIHSYSPRNNILSAVVGRLHKIPVIWHERNMIYKTERDISKMFCFLPDQIICNSAAVASRFKTGHKNHRKIKVILNGVDINQFNILETYSDAETKYGSNGQKVVGLISNLGKRKMPEYFIEAGFRILEQYRNTVFYIVGGEFSKEDKGRLEALKALVKKTGLEKKFIFTGFISNVSEIIKFFDVGVAVTENEACSRAILEMSASGVPVVAFDTGGNSELIDSEVSGLLVKFEDLNSIASSVVDLLDNPTKRKSMGLNARKKAELEFDIKTNTKRTEQLYHELIHKNPIKLESEAQKNENWG